jgi:hypothetical protein
MFSAVNQFSQNYYDQLPADGLKAAGLSVVFSFTASIVMLTLITPSNQAPNNLSRAGLAAGIAFLATSIHALTTPIFNYLFDNPNNQTLNGFQEFIKVVIDITLAHILINYTTALKVNLITTTSINLHDGNFICLPNNLFEISTDMALRCFGSSYAYRNSTPAYVIM